MSGRRGLALVVAAQFLGALADGALVLVAIQLLQEREAPGWTVPALRATFYVAAVGLAAFAGAAADAWPKQRVLVASGLGKVAGCALLLAGIHPLVAYAFAGFAAVAHGPARYGILGELVPAEGLVAANGWMETATVAGSVLGIVLAGSLLSPWAAAAGHGTGAQAAAVLLLVYLAAVVASVPVPSQPAADALALHRPASLPRQFLASARRLLADPDARTSVAATSLFWAAAAVLQFLVLRWAADQLGLPLSGGALLQALFAVALVAGAAAAGRWVGAGAALRVLPAGIAAGAGIAVAAFITQQWLAAALLAVVGSLAGFLLVPMNALLQLRGCAVMEPGRAIAAQNAAENLASVVLLAAYGVLTVLDVPVRTCLVALGALLAAGMAVLWCKRRAPAPAGANDEAAHGRPRG